eukprot:scaffold20282_cov89-Amphora_coffeaeformis.AAC.2
MKGLLSAEELESLWINLSRKDFMKVNGERPSRNGFPIKHCGSDDVRRSRRDEVIKQAQTNLFEQKSLSTQWILCQWMFGPLTARKS